MKGKGKRKEKKGKGRVRNGKGIERQRKGKGRERKRQDWACIRGRCRLTAIES